MNLSIIIPYHNEGREFILEGINQIRNTIDVDNYEIIVVDDFSDIPLDISDVTIIRQPENLGVGAAFDRGVLEAKYENIFLTASDVRFIDNKWASQLVNEIQQYPKSITCTTCIGLNKEKLENMDFNKRRLTHRCQGANLLVFHDHKTHPKKPENFRNIFEGQWRKSLNVKQSDIDSFEIQCLMGAAYGVTKDWYNYIDGFAGHKLWGTLEPYISLKSWLFGGTIRLAPRIETGHIFKREGTHKTPLAALIYNKIFVATVLFEDADTERLVKFLGNNNTVITAKQMVDNNISFIKQKEGLYKSKIKRNYEELFNIFCIDFRKCSTFQ